MQQPFYPEGDVPAIGQPEKKEGVNKAELERDFFRLLNEDYRDIAGIYSWMRPGHNKNAGYRKLEKFSLEDLVYLNELAERELKLAEEQNVDVKSEVSKKASGPIGAIRQGVNKVVSRLNMVLPQRILVSKHYPDGSRYTESRGRISSVGPKSEIQDDTMSEISGWRHQLKELQYIFYRRAQELR